MRRLIFTLCTLALFVRADDKLLERGFPAHDREWLPADYEKAGKLICEPNSELPTLTDKVSAPYFARLTSTENLSFPGNKSLPLQTRVQGYLTMQSAQNAVLKRYGAYASSKRDGKRLHSEMAHLGAFSLRLGAVGLALVEEIIPTIARDDKYEIRMGGLRKVHSGMTTMFQGAVSNLTESDFYSSEDLSLLLKAMEDVIPSAAKVFTDNYKGELRKSLSDLKPRFSKEADQKSIEAVLKQIGG